jgi:hypothetical protein
VRAARSTLIPILLAGFGTASLQVQAAVFLAERDLHASSAAPLFADLPPIEPHEPHLERAGVWLPLSDGDVAAPNENPAIQCEHRPEMGVLAGMSSVSMSSVSQGNSLGSFGFLILPGWLWPDDGLQSAGHPEAAIVLPPDPKLRVFRPPRADAIIWADEKTTGV